jgi:hypothetical protein
MLNAMTELALSNRQRFPLVYTLSVAAALALASLQIGSLILGRHGPSALVLLMVAFAVLAAVTKRTPGIPRGLLEILAINAALLSGWVATHGVSSELVAGVVALAILAVVANWNPGVSVGLLVIAAMNGVPGIDLEPHFLAGYRVSDIAVGLLAGGLVMRVYARGAPAGLWARRLSICGAALGAWWLLTLLRTTFNGVPVLKGFLFGRDFLYFALLLPLVAAGLRGRRELLGCLGTLFAGALLFSVGLVATSALGASLHGFAGLFVHASMVNEADSEGIKRVYSTMGDSLPLILAFGLGVALMPPGKLFARRLGILLFVVGGIATLYLFTRALYIGIAVALVGTMILWRFGGGSRNAARRGVGALYAVLILLVVMVNFGALARRTPALNAASVRTGMTITEFQHQTGNVGYRYTLDQKMLDVLGSNWIGGLGFLHPDSHPVAALPFGSIRNGDTGIMNSVMTMGVVGTVLLYLAPVAILIAVIRRWQALTEHGEQRSLEWFFFGMTMWLLVVLVTSISLVTLFSVSGLVMSAAVIGCAARLLDETRPRV